MGGSFEEIKYKSGEKLLKCNIAKWEDLNH